MIYRTILIVEDDPTLRRVIRLNLAGRGHDVREAATAGEAVAAVRARRPDLMLLDINLPDRTGWDVLRELRRDAAEVPTIVVSAVRIGRSRLEEFRPLAYLPKPFPLEALLRLVGEPMPDEDTDRSGSTPGAGGQPPARSIEGAEMSGD